MIVLIKSYTSGQQSSRAFFNSVPDSLSLSKIKQIKLPRMCETSIILIISAHRSDALEQAALGFTTLQQTQLKCVPCISVIKKGTILNLCCDIKTKRKVFFSILFIFSAIIRIYPLPVPNRFLIYTTLVYVNLSRLPSTPFISLIFFYLTIIRNPQ